MKKYLFLSVAAFFILSACDSGDSPKDLVKYEPINLTPSGRSVVNEMNDFAWNLFQGLNSSDEANIVISPLSASYTLSMMANGALGETQKQIVDALGFSSLTEANDLCAQLSKELPTADKSTKFALANSIWAQPNILLNKAFTENMAYFYNYEFRQINQSSLQADINNWCANNTNDCIREFPFNLKSPEIMLVNACYFKGIWSNSVKFNPDKTATGTFYCSDGSELNPKFMNNKAEMQYFWNETSAICRLPFGNGAFGLCLILPDKDKSIDDVVEYINKNGWKAATANNNIYDVTLSLPKFKIESTMDLIPAAQKMGMDFWDGENCGDFSNLTPTNIAFREFLQKSTFEIDEEGVTASSASAANGELLAPPPSENVKMVFDRPFLFAINETSTGTILFMGKVEHP